MPTNFVQPLQTVNPEVVVTDPIRDTSVADLAESVGPVLEDYAESRKEAADMASVGNFNSDLATLQERIDSLQDAADLEKLSLIEKRDAIMRDSSKTEAEKQATLNAFQEDMSKIALREQQSGIQLEANRRAVVRKWTALRPDLAPAFQKSLAIDAALRQMDRYNPQVDATISEVTKLQQQALANNTTPEHIASVNRYKLDAEASTARVTDMTNMGKINMVNWEAELFTPNINAGIKDAQLVFTRGAAQMASGGVQSMLQAKQQLVNMKNAALSAVETTRAGLQATHGIVVDTSKQVEYINVMYNQMINTLESRDAMAINELAELYKNDAADAASLRVFQYFAPELAAMMGDNPRAANRVIGLVVDNYMKVDRLGIMQKLRDGKFPLYALGAQGGGSPESKTAMLMLQTQAEGLLRAADPRTNPNSPLSPSDAQFFGSIMKAIVDNGYISPEDAARAGPLFSIILGGVADDPKAKPNERDNARTALGWEWLHSFDNWLFDSNFKQPNARGATELKRIPNAQYNSMWQDTVDKKLLDMAGDLLPGYTTLVGYDPTDKAAPFKVSVPVSTEGSGGPRKGYLAQQMTNDLQYKRLQDFVTKLNEAYTGRANTRPMGIADAQAWARDLHETINPNAQEISIAPVTSNAPTKATTSNVVEISDEDFQRFLDGEDPSVILKEQAVRGR